MMMVVAILLAVQDPTIHDVREKHEKEIKAITGVLDVSVGGLTDDLRIIIRVDSAETKDAVKKLTGEKLDGYKVYIQITAPVQSQPKSTTTTTEPLKKAKVEKEPQFPEDRDNVWKAAVQDCDIVRDHLGLKEVTRKNKEGKVVEPCRLVLRQVIQAGGGHSYYYTKHRADCPVRLGHVKQPDWADAYLKWVFTQGFGPVARGSFLWPFELKGSDRLWLKQVRDDLMSRLNYIREGAQWIETPDDTPGKGWTWEAPDSGSTPKPTPTDK